MTPKPPLCDIAALRQIEKDAPHWLTPADRHALRLHRAPRAPLAPADAFPLVCAFAVAAALAVAAFAWFTPCATEDSSNCYWNAAERGNGTGASFLDIGGAIIWQGAKE